VAQAGTATSRRTRDEANSYNVIRLSPQGLVFTIRVWDGRSFAEARVVEYEKTATEWRPRPSAPPPT
jgi:hypothetical protein